MDEAHTLGGVSTPVNFLRTEEVGTIINGSTLTYINLRSLIKNVHYTAVCYTYFYFFSELHATLLIIMDANYTLALCFKVLLIAKFKNLYLDTTELTCTQSTQI